MSIPGQAKNKYTHEVKFVRSKCSMAKIAVALFVLFVAGMLIGIMCNMSSMRRRQDEMFREINEFMGRERLTGNNQQHSNNHHSIGGPQNEPYFYYDKYRGTDCYKNNRQEQPLPKCRIPHPPPHHQAVHESLNDLRATLQEEIKRLESRVEQLNRSLNSKGQFLDKLETKMQVFMDYMRAILEPLKKLKNWF